MAKESAEEMTRLEVKKESMQLSDGKEDLLIENDLQGTSTFADDT